MRDTHPTPRRALRQLLLDAKFSVPQPRPGSVSRAGLIEAARSKGHRIVGITAPAGYGKSTLLGQWARVEDRRVAWVSLDRFDDDPATLLTSLAAAYCRAGLGSADLIADIAGAGVSPLGRAAPRLASETRASAVPFVFMLDDLHEVQSHACHDVLGVVTSAIPPGSQLAAASRSEQPHLPRFRVAPTRSRSGCSSPATRSRPKSRRSTASWASRPGTTRCNERPRWACSAASRRHHRGRRSLGAIPASAGRSSNTHIRVMPRPPSRPDDRGSDDRGGEARSAGLQWARRGARTEMGRTVRYQEILRRLAIVDEGFVGNQAGLVLGLPDVRDLDPKTAALVRVGVLAAIGAPEVCLEWSSSQALAVGASEDEITGVLLAIAPVIGLGRMVGAAPGVAGAFGYDIEAALEDPDEL